MNTFRRATDLRRVRALDSALVEAIIPLVVLAPLPDIAPASAPETMPATYANSPQAVALTPGTLDVNTAGLSAWKQLPGIGDYRAERIMKFRLKFGGFYALQQIAETPDLPDSTYRQILPYLRVGKITRKIAVNYAGFNELKEHPYISRNLANVIVKNREKFGPFSGPEDLNRIRLITDENRGRILPYLSFE